MKLAVRIIMGFFKHELYKITTFYQNFIYEEYYDDTYWLAHISNVVISRNVDPQRSGQNKIVVSTEYLYFSICNPIPWYNIKVNLFRNFSYSSKLFSPVIEQDYSGL